MSIGLQIKRLCWDNDVSQNDLADAIGVTSSTLSRYANSYKYPRADVLKAIADYFKVDDMNYFWRD